MGQYSGPERLKNDAPSYRKVIDVTTATRTMSTDESGALVLLDLATGIDIALPAIKEASDIGTWFEFRSVLAVSSDTYTITAQAGDLLAGRVIAFDTDTADTIASYAPDGSDDLIITFSDTADLPGSWVKVTAISLTRWLVEGVIYHTGNAATPFS